LLESLLKMDFRNRTEFSYMLDSYETFEWINRKIDLGRLARNRYWILPRGKEDINLKEVITSLIKDIDNFLKSIQDKINNINNDEIQELITGLSSNLEIQFSLSIWDFIPSFISRIDIIEEDDKKETFIEKFESKKKIKDRLSLMYLAISSFIFIMIISFNYNLYLDNISSDRTLDKFILEFLGHNIYLFVLESFLLVIAFYFLWLFKTYSKIVELYDSHILLIESDFYYKDDKGLNTIWIESFNLRKENTQKIHSLPEKTFEMLNWKNEVKTELPILKVLEKIWDTLEKIVLRGKN
jgi:hypothetical protein